MRKSEKKKIGTPVDALCKGNPIEFAQYLNYCRSIHFEDKPDYSYLRKLFRDLFVKEGYKYDAMYDWTILKAKENERTASTSSMDDKNDKVTTDSTNAVNGSRLRSSTSDNVRKDSSSEDKQAITATQSSSKLVERKSASLRKVDSNGTGSATGETKSSSFIKLRRNKDKDEDKAEVKTPVSGVRGFLAKSRESAKNFGKSKGKEET